MKRVLLPAARKNELNTISLNIEFLVISVIQGMALQILVVNVIPVVSDNKFEFLIYSVSAFVLILIFWSQSIIHALSFIDWPIDLIHTFLYFLASFIEVLTFSYITNPLQWFIFGLIFIVISGILYVYDFLIIKRHEADICVTTSGKKLYTHIRTHHMLEMIILVPSAIIFNSVSIWLIYSYPTLFLTQHAHVVLAALQCIFSLILLIFSVHSFKKRAELISQHI